MRRNLFKMAFAAALLAAIPAQADDAALKKDIDQIVVAYMEGFNKHDPAAIAKLYATDYLYVNAQGVHTDITKVLDAGFKMGVDKLDAKAVKAVSLSPDIAMAQGEAKVTGKNTSTGAEINSESYWTATYIKEGGIWKIKMLTGVPKPPAK